MVLYHLGSSHADPRSRRDMSILYGKNEQQMGSQDLKISKSNPCGWLSNDGKWIMDDMSKYTSHQNGCWKSEINIV